MQATADGEGKNYFARGKQIVADIDRLETGVRESAGQIGELLRVSCNKPFGLHKVAPLIPKFLETYPDISPDVSLSYNAVALIRDGSDLAVGNGVLADSTIRARRLIASLLPRSGANPSPPTGRQLTCRGNSRPHQSTSTAAPPKRPARRSAKASFARCSG